MIALILSSVVSSSSPSSDPVKAAFRLLDLWSVAEAPDAEGILLLAGNGRTVATPDVVMMEGARACRVLRRIDGAVQVGGVNVYPARVAAALATHALVAEARVRLSEGGRLKALVVPRPADADADGVRRELLAWVAANLPVAERPRSITVLPRLPADALGKPLDWAEAAGPVPLLAARDVV